METNTAPRPGIAIITYKRPQLLEVTLDYVLRYTSGDYSLVVSSDEPENPTVQKVCAEREVVLLEGPNKGVVWNKNRALHYFMTRTNCDPILLLEDDSHPIEQGWLDRWVEAIALWDHVNLSTPGLLATPPGAVEGSGSPQDPHRCVLVTGQCTGTSRRAMEIVGYLDPRFQGYGYGHAEWSLRHSAMLHPEIKPPSSYMDIYLSIDGGIRTAPAPTFGTKEAISRNASIMKQTRQEKPAYKTGWRTEKEKAELDQQVAGAPQAGRGVSVPWKLHVHNLQPLQPRMSPDEIACLERNLRNTKYLVEFGCGGSTLLALRSGVRWTASVESDLAWIVDLRRRGEIIDAEQSDRLAFIHGDIGPTGGWGAPEGDRWAIKWPGYYRTVWTKLADPRIINTVLIDGRFRVACALTSMLYCQPATRIIMHDFWDRPFYHDVLSYADVVERADTMAVLKRKRNIDWREFGLSLQAAALDPR